MRAASLMLFALLFFGSLDTATRTVMAQTVRLYGARGGPTAIVSSGDGGWIHLAPHVAELLAARGWFVIGFDSRAYLSSVTEGPRAITAFPTISGSSTPN